MNKIVFLLMLLSLALGLAGLGNQFFWADEGETLLLAQHILERGWPFALSAESRLCPNLGLTQHGLWTGQPWVQFYVAALALALFGKSIFFLRLPFVIIGSLCVPLLWNLGKRFECSERTRVVSCLLLATNVPLLLLFRNVRYYAFLPFFTLCLLILYDDLRRRQKNRWLLLGLMSAAFMHTMPPVAAAVIVALFLHALFVERDRRLVAQLLLAQGIMLVLFLPWLGYSWEGLTEFYRLRAASTLGRNLTAANWLLGLCLYLLDLVAFNFPLLLVIPLYVLPLLKIRVQFLKPANLSLLLMVMVSICAVMSFMFNSNLWAGYVCAAIPLLLLISANVIDALACERHVVLVGLLFVVITSNLFNLPHIPLRKGLEPQSGESLSERRFRVFKGRLLHSRVFFGLSSYLREITHDYLGPVEEIVAFLNAHAKPGDTFAAVNDNYTLQFMTGLRRVEAIPFSEPPTWIIPRGMSTWKKAFCNADHPDADGYMTKYLSEHGYVTVALEAPDLYHENEPILPQHQFVTPKLARKVVLFHHGPLTEVP